METENLGCFREIDSILEDLCLGKIIARKLIGYC